MTVSRYPQPRETLRHPTSPDYIVQGARFQIVEEVGCASVANLSLVTILLIDIWPIILPTISVLFYCRELYYRMLSTQVTKACASTNHLDVFTSVERDE